MPRMHRELDWATKELVVTPFTPEEEAKADQRDLDIAARKAAESTPEARIDRAFIPSDKDRVLFEAFFELSNRVIALEGGPAITRAELKHWLKSKLP